MEQNHISKPLRRYSRIDSGSLCRLFRTPDVYIPSSDDHSKPEDLQRFVDNALHSPFIYAMGHDPRHEAFIFAPSHNSTTFAAHFAVRKDMRSSKTVESAAMAGKFVFENTTCKSIICFIREDNMPALSIIGQLGMKRVGRLERSVLFNGEFLDELIFQGTVEDYNKLWSERLGEVK